MRCLATIFFLSLITSLYAQKPVPNQATAETAMKPTEAFQTSISKSKTSLTKLSEWLDEWEKQLNAEETTRTSNLNLSKSNVNRIAGAPIITSRSNIKQLQAALDNLEMSDPAHRKAKLKEVQKGLADLEAPIQELYNSILAMGEKYAGKAAELKTRHDTVKNSIGNIR